MDADAKPGEKLTPAFVRDKLDEILTQEITALLDVDPDFAMLSFNLTSISCITLIVEKEREIKQYSDFPPERYTKESFLNELMEIGLEKDETLEKTIDSVLNKGYVGIDSNGELKSEMPAFMMVGFLDSMFPGMQGMNLVAFVLQMNDEVNSGRKSLELATQSFKAALKSRGVSVSKDRAEKKASEIVSGRVSIPRKSREVARKLKKKNMDRLSKFIKKRKKRSVDSSGQLNIKDVFDKESSKEALTAQKDEIRKADDQAEKALEKAAELTRELARKEKKIREAEAASKEAEKQLKELELREKQLLVARDEARKAAEKTAEIEARMAEKELLLKTLEERLKQEEEQKLLQEEEAKQKKTQEAQIKEVSRADEDIASQIAAFESELTMPCPLCKDGEIIPKTTEKGKDFFTCSKSDCRFVSWDKPYHFECPLCKNLFLTEMTTPSGEKGLKCPRASCSYTQNNLLDPKQNMVLAAAESAPKKKKKIVRRRKRY
ncbi:DNA topoisomerase I [Desulfobacula toluolica]|uniref:Putative DNA topoisomerase I n=1 Tax=Desulfobacula toluolica (strain DSM 7467 / Tol2) TaxID=651182 RepID=K0NJG0_DESTT|nr:DNA topoisomerase I [Desulfobacula toluolica]CCK81606.1 putative DNA topoisomerase I [Desulfobacula toluolica Tol2]